MITRASALHRRDVRLEHAGSHPGAPDWYAGGPFVAQFLNAYTLLVPEGEHFVIRTCRRFMGVAPPTLRADLDALFHQEGAHAREHGKLRRAMRAAGLGLDRFVAAVGVIAYRWLEPLVPARLRLAAAAGIEHHNAAIAEHFLERDRLRAVRDPTLRTLFQWHFIEEVEHREVVFDLLAVAAPGHGRRIAGLGLSIVTFLVYVLAGALLLGVRTGAAFTGAFWRDAGRQCVGREGLIRALARASVRYLRPGFRPRVAESRALLARAGATLERLRARPPGRDLPRAFRALTAPFLERARAIEARHPFFFGRIEGYDGAWVIGAGARKLNFCTYSYLGLLHHPDVQRAAARAIRRYGTGTHGVRLLGGNLDLHEALEARLAAFHGREAAITFSSGFMTNVAVIGALLRAGDFVLSDALNHASIVDGCRLSRARVVTFRHRDVADLEVKLRDLPADARKLIVVDGVFSMDGDVAPLDALLALRARCPNTILMVDEAHSLGVLGAGGRGIEEHFGCRGAIDVLMGTLSKTLPAQGGYVAGSEELIRYLRYHARGFVFSAALAPASAAAALAGLDVLEREGAVRHARLVANVGHFTARLRAEGFDLGATGTAIVPIMTGSEARAFEMARECNRAGLHAMPVAFPAVARGAERVRLNVTATHRRADLDHAVGVLVAARAAVEARLRG